MSTPKIVVLATKKCVQLNRHAQGRLRDGRDGCSLREALVLFGSKWNQHSVSTVLCLLRTLLAGPSCRDRSLIGRIWVTASVRNRAASLIAVGFNFEGISRFSAAWEADRGNNRHVACWNTSEATEKWIPATAAEATLLTYQVQSYTIGSAMKKTTGEGFPGKTSALWWWQWPWQAMPPKDFIRIWPSWQVHRWEVISNNQKQHQQ